jgi:hypothetical protein
MGQDDIIIQYGKQGATRVCKELIWDILENMANGYRN